MPALPPLLRRAVEAVRARLARGGAARVAFQLGSGLGDAAVERSELLGAVPYPEIPGLPPPSVPGHAGRLELRTWGGIQVWVLAGRIHLYEGHPMETVLLPVRLVAALGARVLVSTHAVGGIRPDLAPGDLALVADHLNLTGRNPLGERSARQYGEVFLALDRLYDPEVRAAFRDGAAGAGVELKDDVTYAAFPGPTYETPAEIRMARRLGADVAGMSLVPEALAARQCGLAVGAVACVTNRAAGTAAVPPSHEEVLAAGRRLGPRLGALLAAALPRLAALAAAREAP